MRKDKPGSDSSPALATVIIPAHNEASVIGRCLESIYNSIKPGEFEVIVVCNGCTDDTAKVVATCFPLVKLLETPVASKVDALNYADTEARYFPRIFLDADLSVSADSLRALISPLQDNKALASCGRMEIDASRSNVAVKAFYRVWQYNSYFEQGKFGGLFSVSERGHARITPFPHVVNDDELVRRKFCATDRAYVESCSFKMTAPLTLDGLIKIRLRAIRGTVQLEKMGYANSDGTSLKRFSKFMARVIRKPSAWLSLPVYLLLSGYIRCKGLLTRTKGSDSWERDETSREYA